MAHKINNNFELKKKSLLDERLTPVDTLSLLPNPNTPSNFIPEGAEILVRDSGLNYQAQRDPLNINNLIWVVSNVNTTPPISGVAFIDINYSTLLTLYNAGTLQKGAFYKIIDRADAGIVIQATETKELSTSGVAMFLLADYQFAGTYSSTPVVFTSNRGIWSLSLSPSVSNGDVVIWNGLMYQCFNSSAKNSSSPDLNNLAYSLLSKTLTNGYIKETHIVVYNFLADSISKREDIRGNIVNSQSFANFQWGNSKVSGNVVENSASLNCINQRGFIRNNFLSNNVIVSCTNDHVGNLRKNTFHNNGFTYICNGYKPGTDVLQHCIVSKDEDITFLPDAEYNGLECTNHYSSFYASVDMSVDFSSNDLTLPSGLNYIGKFLLINNTGQVIEKIFNLPSFNSVSFEVEDSLTQSFFHTPISTAVDGNLVSDSAVTNIIVGRTAGSDIIEYKLTGVTPLTLCRRSNIIKLS